MTDHPHSPPSHVCRCEEIDADAIRGAITAGGRSVNDVKRQTRAGMGPCQGIFCVPTIATLLATETGLPPDRIAPMTARPPVRSLPLERLAETDG